MRRFAADRVVIGNNRRVIYNGIDCEAFKPGRDEGLRAELGVTPGDILVGAVGNLRRPKDYPTFVRAASELAKRSPRYRFVIAGAADEPIKSELLQMIGDLGLTDRLSLLGFRNDVERIMSSLDVYVLSSRTEGFSLTTVQAMACGIPVVATRCGGPEEIVHDHVTGRLIGPGDPGALADAIAGLFADDSRRIALSNAGRLRAQTNFSLDAMISAYSATYNQCLGIPASVQHA
jgi:glycosyltransferase involved in cell wall biosynthesis